MKGTLGVAHQALDRPREDGRVPGAWLILAAPGYTGNAINMTRGVTSVSMTNYGLHMLLLWICVIIGILGFRNAILVGIAIPGSFLTAILAINLMGLTVNMVVLFALIFSVGMLVDAAIIVTEYADRKMAEGLDRRQAFINASKRMALPIISATATTLGGRRLSSSCTQGRARVCFERLSAAVAPVISRRRR